MSRWPSRVWLPALLLVALPTLFLGADPVHALRPIERSSLVGGELEVFLESELGSAAVGGRPDTVRLGGDGFGNVVRGGEWDWETLNPAVTPETFPDGKSVGNEYADGWIFEDRTTRSGPSQVGSGHWKPDGTYVFAEQGLTWAHRATVHANDGADDGPDPLVGSWSLWIGTNLSLNPRPSRLESDFGKGDSR